MATEFQTYLQTIQKPFDKVVRLDFLQPDESSVAFSVGNSVARGYMRDHPPEALIQSGTLSVSLQNGKRRTCSVKLSNAGSEFDFAVNNLWFGNKVRLMMGVVLPNGTPYYFPQGVFLISEPKTEWRQDERTIDLSLVDKWAMLDGTLGGKMSYALQIDSPQDNRPNVFALMAKLLAFNRFTLEQLPVGETDVSLQLDPIPPRFTDFYNGFSVTQEYLDGTTEVVPFTALTYNLTVGNGSSIANAISELNTLLASWYGYDATGRFFVDPSQDDLDDSQKPPLWNFSTKDPKFIALSESVKSGDLYNNVVICGQGSSYGNYYGRAYNADPASATNIYKVGLKTFWQNESNLSSEKQCKDLAAFYLRRKATLATTATLRCGQFFHFYENSVVTVRREDLADNPIKRYLVTGYTLPLADEGEMQLNLSSISGESNFQITTEGGIG